MLPIVANTATMNMPRTKPHTAPQPTSPLRCRIAGKKLPHSGHCVVSSSTLHWQFGHSIDWPDENVLVWSIWREYLLKNWYARVDWFVFHREPSKGTQQL
ncbi:MAG TPA: hypothetical protein P5307_11540 [Pirellulaceae bacterium]|nr:hypothetical protein [Pirellulaceae bacterium]